MGDLLPREILDKIIQELFAAGEEDAWRSMASVNRDFYDSYLVPANRKCEETEDWLLNTVTKTAMNASWNPMEQTRRDGTYIAEDRLNCDAFPRRHVHQACLKYTRFGLDLDHWDYSLDGHDWQIYG